MLNYSPLTSLMNTGRLLVQLAGERKPMPRIISECETAKLLNGEFRRLIRQVTCF